MYTSDVQASLYLHPYTPSWGYLAGSWREAANFIAILIQSHLKKEKIIKIVCFFK